MQELKRLTAAELGLTETTFDRLIEVRDDLDTGRLVHFEVPDFGGQGEFIASVGKPFFNMVNWCLTEGCGTAMCIGGSMKHKPGFEFTSRDDVDGDGFEDDQDILDPLFYPYAVADWEKLNAAQAVRAIDWFVSGEKMEPWTKAVEDIPTIA